MKVAVRATGWNCLSPSRYTAAHSRKAPALMAMDDRSMVIHRPHGTRSLRFVTWRPWRSTNPIPASINVKLRTPGVYGQVVETLEAPAGVVKRVDETRKVVDAIVSITNVLRTIGLVMLVMVGLTVLFIVVNTIRMAVMARADEIEIMRLVGASDAFIRWPFIFEGLLVGLFGAGVTLFLLLLAAAPISGLTNAIVTQVPVGFDQQLGMQLLVLVVAAGAAMGGVGAWISVRSYLIK